MVSRPEDLRKEHEHIKKVLSVAGYPKWTWQKASHTSPARSDTTDNSEKSYGSVKLPYIQGLTEKLSRRMRANGVQVHVRPLHKLRNVLVSPKDTTPHLQLANIVYMIECEAEGCSERYVGETGRKLEVRSKEHMKKGPVSDHLQQASHTFTIQNTKVLERETDWFRRGVKEAIQIYQQDATLNLDRGRHYLDDGYKCLLSQRAGLTSPSGGNPRH